MLWLDIETIVQNAINSDVAAGKRFTPYYYRLIAGMVENEVSALSRCVVQTNSFTTTIGTPGYDLPVDCLEVFQVSFNDIPLDYQSERRIMPATTSNSTPTSWSKFGSKIVLYPTPATADTCEIWFYKKTPPYCFSLVHVPDTGNTNMTVSFTATSIEFTGTGGSDTGTTTFDTTQDSLDTVAEVVAKINSTMATVTATISPETETTTDLSNIEVRSAVKIYNARELCMFNPQVPSEAMQCIVAGIIEYMKQKDMEYGVMQQQESKYRGLLKRLIIEQKRHRSAQNNHGIRRVYRNLSDDLGSIIIS